MAVDNTAVARRLIDEVWTKGNLDVIDELVARDVVIQDPSLPQGKGTEDLRQHVRRWRTAFPDMNCMIEDVFASSSDRVVVRWMARGTHRGALAGIAPTARSAAIKGCALMRIAEGKIVELTAYYDQLNLLQQLGVVPAMDKIGKGVGGASARA